MRYLSTDRHGFCDLAVTYATPFLTMRSVCTVASGPAQSSGMTRAHLVYANNLRKT